jgi:hypothetical protein
MKISNDESHRKPTRSPQHEKIIEHIDGLNLECKGKAQLNGISSNRKTHSKTHTKANLITKWKRNEKYRGIIETLTPFGWSGKDFL